MTPNARTISFIGRGKCNEIDIVIARASMCMLRGITVVFKCILASCRIKGQLYGEYGIAMYS